MIFGTVVDKVGGARCPKVAELVLIIPETDPMELHVHWFGLKMNYGLVGYSKICGVVALDGSFGLWPANFDESLEEGHHFFGTYEEAYKFRFSSQGHDKLDGFWNCEDWSIDVGNGDVLR